MPHRLDKDNARGKLQLQEQSTLRRFSIHTQAPVLCLDQYSCFLRPQFHRNKKQYFCSIALRETQMLNTFATMTTKFPSSAFNWVNYFQEHQRIRKAFPIFYTCRVKVAASFFICLCYGYYMAITVRSSPITADCLVTSQTMSDSLTLESNCSR